MATREVIIEDRKIAFATEAVEMPGMYRAHREFAKPFHARQPVVQIGMIEMKPPDAVAAIVDHIAGEQDASNPLEQSNRARGMARYMHDFEDTVAEIDDAAVNQQPVGSTGWKAMLAGSKLFGGAPSNMASVM